LEYGFVYLWFDKKHKRYYVGCHWGTENDGYICSSKWMKQGYKHRPTDFKRRILKRVYTNREELLEAEYHYLKMIKPEELRKRYYNIRNHHWGHWSANPDTRSIREKISKSKIGKPIHSDEYKKRLSEENSGENNYFYGKKWNGDHPRGMLGKKHSAESNKKRSESLKAIKEDWIPTEKRKRIGRINSEKMKLLWQDPEYRKHSLEARKLTCQTSDYIKNQSNKVKLLWQDPEYRKRQLEARKKKVINGC